MLTLALVFSGIILGPELLHRVDDSFNDYSTTYLEFADISCSDKFEGYCLNEGICFYSEDAEGPACICKRVYGGKHVTTPPPVYITETYKVKVPTCRNQSTYLQKCLEYTTKRKTPPKTLDGRNSTGSGSEKLI